MKIKVSLNILSVLKKKYAHKHLKIIRTVRLGAMAKKIRNRSLVDKEAHNVF